MDQTSEATLKSRAASATMRSVLMDMISDSFVAIVPIMFHVGQR